MPAPQPSSAEPDSAEPSPTDPDRSAPPPEETPKPPTLKDLARPAPHPHTTTANDPNSIPRFCPECQYHLSGHPPGAICPECGSHTPNGYIEVRGYLQPKYVALLNLAPLFIYAGVFTGFRDLLLHAVVAATVGWGVPSLFCWFPQRSTAIRFTRTGIEIGPVGQVPQAEIWNSPIFVEPVSSMGTRGLKVSLRTHRNNDKSIPQTLFVTLPSPVITSVVEQCNRWIASVDPKPPLPELARTCPACRHQIDAISETQCPGCRADVSALPAHIPIFKPARSGRFHLMPSDYIMLGPAVGFAVLFVLRPSTFTLLMASIFALPLAFSLLLARSRKPRRSREWRVAPVGRQTAWSTDPVKLSPWRPKESFHFQTESIGVQKLNRSSIHPFFVIQTHSLRLSFSAARALEAAARYWFPQK